MTTKITPSRINELLLLKQKSKVENIRTLAFKIAMFLSIIISLNIIYLKLYTVYFIELYLTRNNPFNLALYLSEMHWAPFFSLSSQRYPCDKHPTLSTGP